VKPIDPRAKPVERVGQRVGLSGERFGFIGAPVRLTRPRLDSQSRERARKLGDGLFRTGDSGRQLACLLGVPADRARGFIDAGIGVTLP
jgi:hypothetical protein